MLVYVKNGTNLLDELKIREGLKSIGISKDIIFSDCYKNAKERKICKCNNWEFLEKDIKINFFSPILFEPKIIRRISNSIKFIFTGNPLLIKQGHKEEAYGICLNKNNIFIFPGSCFEQEVNIFGILKHELLHTKENKHCKIDSCLFYGGGTQIDFCDEHKEMYYKILDEININTERKNVE